MKTQIYINPMLLGPIDPGEGGETIDGQTIDQPDPPQSTVTDFFADTE